MTQVVIAARGGPGSKSRLASALSEADRADLVAAMLEDMLAAVAGCTDVSAAWVVTPTPDLAALAARHGAHVVAQTGPRGLNAGLRQALAEVSERAPYDGIALMPGDLPLLQAADLSAAILLLRTHAIVLAPSLDGGTGLVGVRAGASLAPAFGAGSFRRHAEAARRSGLTAAVVEADSLAHDVDRPDDLGYLLDHGPASRAAEMLRQRLQPRISS